jgi:hypothetical protein
MVTRTSENRWSNAKIREELVARSGGHIQPSVFEMVLECQTSIPQQKVLDGVAKRLAITLPTIFGELDVFGCCDVGGPELMVRIDANAAAADAVRMMANAKGSDYSMLGNRIDDLHPLIFGSARLCNGLSKALRKDVKILFGKESRKFAVVRLKSKCDIPSARLQAGRWLIPRVNEAGLRVERQFKSVKGVPLCIIRHWHPNGIQAAEIPERNGVIEGVAKQWNSAGKLLGTFEVRNGNGVEKIWGETGNLEVETTLVGGEWSGRQRGYADDGSVIAETYWIRGEVVSKKAYREACKVNRKLPRYE